MPPRPSLPVRPSLPSPDIVPEALPFTLLSDRPPAMPTARDALDLGAIALTKAPQGAVDLGAALPSTIEVSTLPAASPSPSSNVTVVPSGRSSIPNDLEDLDILPVSPLPVIEVSSQSVEPGGPSSVPAADRIAAELPKLTGAAVITTSPLAKVAPRTFGAWLDRSLSLRPRA